MSIYRLAFQCTGYACAAVRYLLTWSSREGHHFVDVRIE